MAVGTTGGAGGAARFMIVQHAEKQRLPGDPGLTALGRDQAGAVGNRLLGRGVVGLYSSPQSRTRETAAAIGTALGLEVLTDERLRERLNWDGPAQGSFSAFVAEWERSVADRRYVPAGGDSSVAAAARLSRFLDDTDRRHPPGLIVAVSHGGVTVDLLRDLLGDAGVHAAAPGVVEAGMPPAGMTSLGGRRFAWRVLRIGEAG